MPALMAMIKDNAFAFVAADLASVRPFATGKRFKIGKVIPGAVGFSLDLVAAAISESLCFVLRIGAPAAFVFKLFGSGFPVVSALFFFAAKTHQPRSSCQDGVRNGSGCHELLSFRMLQER